MGIANDAETQARAKVIEQGLAKDGLDRRSKPPHRISIRSWRCSRRMLSLAKELVDLHPDVIVGHSTPVVAALHQVTQTIPIVFVVVANPVGSGFVASIARPGGNITGVYGSAANDYGQISVDTERTETTAHPRRPNVQSRICSRWGVVLYARLHGVGEGIPRHSDRG